MFQFSSKTVLRSFPAKGRDKRAIFDSLIVYVSNFIVLGHINLKTRKISHECSNEAPIVT